MKKIVLLLLLCVAGYAGKAQLPFNVGIHGGPSVTKLKLKSAHDATSKYNAGFVVGAFARFNLGPFYVEPSFNYSQRKSLIKYDNGEDKKVKYHSFDIPLMLGFHVLDLKAMKLRTFLGPVASFPGNYKSGGIKEDSKNAVWNGKVGIGVDVWKLTFDVDFEKGFKKLNELTKAPNTFNFVFGFKFI